MRANALGQISVTLSLCLALLFLAPGAKAQTKCPAGAPSTCLTGTGDWTTTLVPRSFDGGITIGGYFDTTLNITWLATPSISGAMDWSTASDWANKFSIGSVSGWRLPAMVDIDNDGCLGFGMSGTDCGVNVITTPGTNPPTGNMSELGHMFYVTLANPYSLTGRLMTNTGPFVNFDTAVYWYGLPYAPTPSTVAWQFHFGYGSQWRNLMTMTNNTRAWAVHDGDVGVPLDVTKPTISAAISAGTPGSNGWYTSDVTVHFTCIDNAGGSGIPAGTCPGDQILSGESAGLSSTSQTVTDAAGNVSLPSNVVTVKIDMTSPSLSPVVSPNPVYLNGSATVSANATDALSGVATVTCGALNTSSLGSKSVTCTATDNAGLNSWRMVSYEVVPHDPSTLQDCKKNGWLSLTDNLGQAFKNQGQCDKYANKGNKAHSGGK